ncbi:MAG: NAD(P)/FAD-dependent oxidoreductase [bacterium]
METVDIAIIGAGVVGLAIAAEISDGRDVVLIERHNSFGQETSSRNSEVIHAGIYYEKDSLKAQLCIEGNRLLYQICETHQIPYQRIGKLIVALEEGEINLLELLFAKGRDNGVHDLKLLSEIELKKMEPNIQAKAAIWSPSTGIIDTHSLMKHFESQAKEKGVLLAYGCEVTSIEKKTSGYEVGVVDTDGEKLSFKSQIVVNSAGLSADKIAGLAGINVDTAGYRLHYAKGEYFKVCSEKSRFIHHLVYPTPTPISLGIHTLLDLSGRMKLGPNAFYVDEIDYGVEEAHRKDFFASAKSILPFLEEDDLSPDMAGIRPKLQAKEEPVRDFVIKEESGSGLPGFINLIGIESPGLTASPAIAKYVKVVVDEISVYV